jgi:Prenyltransferase and squalene oxidase repeat
MGGGRRGTRRPLLAAFLALLLPRGGGSQERVPSPRHAAAARSARDVYAETPVTRAVDRALEYLRSRQEPDGSWVSGLGKSTGIVSLAAMAYLSRGHVPGRGAYGDSLERAIAWVLRQDRDGLVVRDTSHGPMYCHGMSALMLGEALGMVSEDRRGFESMARVHQNAVNVILRAQNVPKETLAQGGWRYNPTSNDSDLSVTGWMVLALRAAQGIGLPVPKRNIDQAVGYIRRCAHPLGGFGYQPGGDPNLARTGTGVLALQLCGDWNSPEALRGGDYIRRNGIEWQGPFFFYTVYYCSQGMYQLGGDYWDSWRERVEPLLLAHQNADGSWPAPPNETHEHQAGPAYTTAMAVLALSVEFRYLPIYQR